MSRSPLLLVLVSIAFGASTAGVANAQSTTAGPQREIRGQLGASINNLGAQQAVEATWKWKRAALGAGGAATPANVRGGVWAELNPHPAFSVRAGAEPAYYFGTFNSLMSFQDYGNRFDTDTRKTRGGAASGAATRMYVTPTVRMRAGRVLAAVSADLEWWRSNASGPLFYEPSRDTLLNTNGDRLIATTSVALYEFRQAAGGTLATGVLHQMTSIDNARHNQVQKVGVIAIQQFTGRHFRLPRPSVTAAVSYYVDDPHKEGQWTATLAIGFKVAR